MNQLPQYYSKLDLVEELKKARPYLGLTYLQILKLAKRGVYKPAGMLGDTPIYDIQAVNDLVNYVDNPPSVYGKAWKTRKEAIGKAHDATLPA